LTEEALTTDGVHRSITTGVSVAGIRALVVEDEADAAELVRQLLEDYGAAVAIATSAREALDIIGTAQPDVLISEL
jgi:CheY-like chemotaxis protein